MREGIKRYGWKQRVRAMLGVLTLSCRPPAAEKEQALQWESCAAAILGCCSNIHVSPPEHLQRQPFTCWRHAEIWLDRVFPRWVEGMGGLSCRALADGTRLGKASDPVERWPVTCAYWFLLSPYPGELLNLMSAKSGEKQVAFESPPRNQCLWQM